MKAVSKLVVLLSLGMLSSGIVSAMTDAQAYLETCRKEPGVPVPTAVVAPSVGPEFNGATVQVEFVVDEKGKPTDLNVKSNTDNALASAVMDAVKQWRFKPAERNGASVATKVVLPIRIVDATELNRLASN